MDLVTQRQITLDFIAVKPDSIVLTPQAKTKQPSGGFVWTPGAARAPLTVSFIESSDQGGKPLPTVTLDGVVRSVDMMVVAPWGSAVAVHDLFVHQGKEWEVVGIFYDNGYETRFQVSSRG